MAQIGTVVPLRDGTGGQIDQDRWMVSLAIGAWRIRNKSTKEAVLED